MRVVTKIGGILFAVTAVVACVGVASAMADTTVVLCKVNAEACKKANFASEAFTATASGAAFNFGELGTFKCSSSMSRNEAGQLSALTFTGCSEGCEVKVSNLPYKATLLSTGSGNGKINMLSGGGGEPVLGVLCGGIECSYGAGTVETEFKGGAPASVVAIKALTKKTGSFLCPKTPKWEATYAFTSPESAVYIGKRAVEGPVFCKVNEKTCPQAQIHKFPEASLQATSSFKITKLVGGTLTCSSALLGTFKGTYESGPYEYAEEPSGCTHPTYTSCSALYEATDYAYLFPSAGGNGEVVIKAGPGGKIPTLRIKCTSAGTPFECRYSTEEYGMEFFGGAAASFQLVGSLTKLEGSATFCPASVVIQATYVTKVSLYMAEA